MGRVSPFSVESSPVETLTNRIAKAIPDILVNELLRKVPLGQEAIRYRILLIFARGVQDEEEPNLDGERVAKIQIAASIPD